MTAILTLLGVAWSPLWWPQAAAAREVPGALRVAIEKATAKVRPALVRIEVVSATYSDGREVKQEGAGSGVIITRKGDIISNHHVAGHAVRMICTLADNEEIPAELIGTDPLSDISILRLRPPKPRHFPVAEFGDSDGIRVGDYVLAMGSPFALSQSVTLGIISNTRLVMPRLFWPFDRLTMDGEDVGSIVRWIGHDAAIYPGNSGGPLVNISGQIIGINEISLGLSGAIPGNLAQGVAQQLLKSGRVRRSWIGLEVQPLLKSDEGDSGVLVGGAIADSPAEKAGFQSGDVLLRLDGRDVTVKFREELPLFNLMVAELPIGRPIKALLRRGQETMTFVVTPEEREAAQPREYELKPWGMTGRSLSFLMAQEMKLDSRDGVLVTSVRPGGPCGEARPTINPMDIIEEVDGTPIRNIEALQEWTEGFVKTHPAPAPVKIGYQRKTERCLTVVMVGIRELQDPGLEATKAWLPVGMQVITRSLAESLKTPDLTGVRVTQVYSNSTAARAGIQAGDLIVKLDGEPIPASQPEDYEVLPTMIRAYKVGATGELTILRGGREVLIPVEFQRSPRLDREMKKYRDEHFDFTARDVSFQDKVDERWGEEQGGVMVAEVVPGGWAALAHLAVGDLIIAVGGEGIGNVEGLEKHLTAIAAQKPKHVVFKVLRGIYTMYLEAETEWEDAK